MSRKPPDFELWSEAAKSVKPLHHQAVRKQTLAAKPLVEIARLAVLPSQIHVHVPRPSPLHPPAITGFDRRTTQRMMRGNVEIERRIDLHGTGIEMARVKLLGFLRQCYLEGTRVVLVITGKGDSPYARHTLHGAAHFHAPERQGRLRRHVPEWLHEHEFRSLVSGFQPAHPKHGGGGAFYVKIRRQRPDR